MPHHECERIADQIERAARGNAWHGPSLHELLSDVTAAEALAKPAPGAHSIWEIARHIGVWAEIVIRRIDGERIEDVPPEEDWPPVHSGGEAEWRVDRKALLDVHEALAACARDLDDVRLDAPAAGSATSPYVLLHGAVQHALYHGGQIGILKRALRSGQSAS